MNRMKRLVAILMVMIMTFAVSATSFAATSSDATAEAEDTTLTFDELELGYYLIDSTVGTLCSLNTTNPVAEITEKNEEPTIEKKVKEDSTGAWGTSNTADIDQKVEYRTVIYAKKGAHNYVLHDTMDAAFSFNNDVVVTIGLSVEDATKEDATVVEATNYTISDPITHGETTHTFDVSFTQEFCDRLTDDSVIVVSYSANLNDNAKISNATTKLANENKVYLAYGDDKNTVIHTTFTYTYEFSVYKFTMDTGCRMYNSCNIYCK